MRKTREGLSKIVNFLPIHEAKCALSTEYMFFSSTGRMKSAHTLGYKESMGKYQKTEV
jgi:hypothetical protein